MLRRTGRANSKVFVSSCVCIVLLFFCGGAAWPQANSATFYGNITDPTGAVVPAAAVTLIGQDTGTSIKKVADDSGEFTYTFVPPGTYTLRIEANGFRPYAATGFTLVAGQQVRKTFSLELGSVTDTVTVEGASPLVNTVSAQQLQNYSVHERENCRSRTATLLDCCASTPELCPRRETTEPVST
jgi:hypothetical protein